MWFEEGVVQFDRYSIDRITEVWMISQPMSSAMRSLMNKFLNCLTVMATEGDTTAISQLKIYYTEGIGIPKNEELADYWGDQLTRYQQTNQPTNTNVATSQKTPVRMQFFARYTFFTESPVGLN